MDAPSDTEIRVVVVDDHVEFRRRVRELVDEAPDMVVVGEAPDGASGVQVAREREPDVVLMDVQMPLMDGIDATAELARIENPAAVIVLTVSGASRDVLDAIAAGAAGYLLKGASGEELWKAIRAVRAGRSPMSAEVTGALLRQVREQRASEQRAQERPAAPSPAVERPTLTEREVAILKLVAEGRDNKEIADQLVVSPGTVKSELANLFAKLGVRTRAQAAVVAVRSGLV